MFKKFDAKEDVVGAQQLKGSVQVHFWRISNLRIPSFFLFLILDRTKNSKIAKKKIIKRALLVWEI